MKYELRKVRPDWEHPTDAAGNNYIPLRSGFRQDLAVWEEEKAQWDRGFLCGVAGEDAWVARDLSDPAQAGTYEQWNGERPDPSAYMPDWTAEEATAWQYYEGGSEGTPVSPVMTKLLPLAQWVDVVQGRVDAALASIAPEFVNEVACELAELIHFETLSHTFLDDDRGQEKIRKHASALVHLLHYQRVLSGCAPAANLA